MKAKTIKAVLRKKIDDWIKSIEDPAVAELVKKNTIVTGGSITSMLMKEQVNDFDVYFRDMATTVAVAEYYAAKFKEAATIKFKDGREVDISVTTDGGRVRVKVKSAGIASENGADDYGYFESQPDESAETYVDSQFAHNLAEGDDTPAEVLDNAKPLFRPVFLSDNAITLSNRIQIVLRFYGEARDLHENYDFVHCTCYWQSWDGVLVLPAAALEAIITKELRYVGSKYPLCSIIRIRKFVARGWHINAGQILKMCMQLNGLNLNNIKVLEDQLTGVDAFYFMQVLDRLRQKQKEDGTEDQPVDTTYLMTVIDRMF